MGNHPKAMCPLPSRCRIDVRGRPVLKDCCVWCRTTPGSQPDFPRHPATSFPHCEGTGQIGLPLGSNDPVLKYLREHRDQPVVVTLAAMRPSWIEVDLDAIESNVL